VQKKTGVGETVVAVTTLDLLIASPESLYFVGTGMSFATALALERAFSGEKEDTNDVILLSVFTTTVVIMAVNAIGTRAPGAILAHFHVVLAVLSGLKVKSTIVVDVVLASCHS
jgi:hypothetical protein